MENNLKKIIPGAPNFTYSEFFREEGFVEPEEGKIKNIEQLAQNVLQPLRDHLGVPVSVMSGYRSKSKVSSNRLSSRCHLEGKAADIKILGKDLKKVLRWIHNNCEYTEIIARNIQSNDGWIHVSYDPSNLIKTFRVTDSTMKYHQADVEEFLGK